MKLDDCPNCGNVLTVRKKECRRCGLGLEADFDESPLVLLPREEQDFILEFVLCGGNFRALSQEVGLTYPTLRTRLDRIITRLKGISRSVTAEGVLEAIDQGSLTAREGIRKLKAIRGPKPPKTS